MNRMGTAERDIRLVAKQARIARELERFQAEARPETEGMAREVADILRSIHDNLFDPRLNVASVKEWCAIRNNNISSRFRWAVGLGIREYIERLRLEAAAQLLREEDLEVYLVAMAVGYDHQETFCRAFQRRLGRPPSEYRLSP